MSRSLAPIPSGVQIVDKAGAITDFFRLRWQQLIDGFQASPLAGSTQKLNQSAALGTTAIYTTKAAGLYRISYYLRKTVIDGVSSSLTPTIGWIESGIGLTEAQPAIANDSVTTGQGSGSQTKWVDQQTDITIAIAYASNTPGTMKWRLDAAVEQLT